MKTKTYLTMILFLLIFMIGCGGSSSDPKYIVTNSFKMIENNDVDGVSDLLASDVKSMISREKLEKGVAEESSKIKEKGGISNIEFTDEKIEENQIDYKIKISYGNGSTKNDKARLVKEDGKWKLGIAKN